MVALSSSSSPLAETLNRNQNLKNKKEKENNTKQFVSESL